MSETNTSRRPGSWSTPAYFSTLLLIEVVIDLIPTEWLFDWILIPAEVVVDALLLLVFFIGQRTGPSRGRRMRTRKAAMSAPAIAALGYWMFFAVVIVAEFYFNSQNPLLGFFALFIELPVDFFLFVAGILVTFFAMRSAANRQNRGRQLSTR